MNAYDCYTKRVRILLYTIAFNSIGSNFRLNLTHVLDTSKYFYIFHIFGDNLVYQYMESNYFLYVIYQTTYLCIVTN